MTLAAAQEAFSIDLDKPPQDSSAEWLDDEEPIYPVEGTTNVYEGESAIKLKLRLIKLCWDISLTLEEEDLSIVIAGRTGCELQHIFPKGKVHRFEFNDLDILVISKEDQTIDPEKIRQKLEQVPEMTIHSSEQFESGQITSESLKESGYASDLNPLSDVYKVEAEKASIPRIPIEFFCNPEKPQHPYRMGDGMTEYYPFDIRHPDATVNLSELDHSADDSLSEESIAYYFYVKEVPLQVLSPAALLCYYLAIHKLPRISELLFTFPDQWSSIFEKACILSPRLKHKLIHFAQQILITYSRNDDFSDPIEGLKSINLKDSLSLEKFKDETLIFLEKKEAETKFTELLRAATHDKNGLNLGDIANSMGVSWEALGNVLFEVKNHPVVIEAFGVALEYFKNIDLPFHGIGHALDVAGKGVAFYIHSIEPSIEQKILNEEPLTESEMNKILAVVITLLFHDVGIALGKKYAGHEILSMYAFADFIKQLANNPSFKPFMKQNFLDELRNGLVALPGTQLIVNKLTGENLNSDRPQKKFEVGSLGMVVDYDYKSVLLKNIQESKSPFPEKITRNELSEEVKKVLSGSSKSVDQLRHLFFIADVSGMVSKDAVKAGTAGLITEAGYLGENPNMPILLGAEILKLLRTAFDSMTRTGRLNKNRLSGTINVFEELNVLLQNGHTGPNAIQAMFPTI